MKGTWRLMALAGLYLTAPSWAHAQGCFNIETTQITCRNNTTGCIQQVQVARCGSYPSPVRCVPGCSFVTCCSIDIATDCSGDLCRGPKSAVALANTAEPLLLYIPNGEGGLSPVAAVPSCSS